MCKNKIIERLKINKPIGHEALRSLAVDIGYVQTGWRGSHVKYEKEGYPDITIVVSTKSDAKIQYNTIRTLRLAYCI